MKDREEMAGKQEESQGRGDCNPEIKGGKLLGKSK